MFSPSTPAAVRPRERSVDVDGVPTAYWEYGDEDAATTLVLVHGFRGDHHGLEPIAARLAADRVVVPDLPGFGVSAPLRSTHDIAGYARWLRGFIEAVQPRGRFVLLGHSFGSIVVSAMLADVDGADAEQDAITASRPDLVVLVNPIGAPALKGPRAVFTRLAIFYYWLSAALPEAIGFGLLRNRLIVRVMSEAMAKTKDKALRSWIHDQHARYFSAFANRDVVLEAFRASVSHDVSEYAARIAEPVQLIAADRDDITPLAAQQRLQTLFPDARLHVMNHVGHLVHYEAPDEAAATIRDFIGEHAE
ncbi:alpha/beta fold hydrolase [Humibacter ginsenosidimutans]|uniref:Alpha/beta hydrolase n=1 Tax=Humibacter ginsenosidimutans TaxID=2599293 RepID=A0A5B8M147_9MICO|nr:alpha/beta hydrolase [Humibacter ginsenosidimutans]QDZ13741.1 alpha/beta hydrolase [Humibacter ginsenosidimutans]